jgi:hypothetical protein
MLQRSLKLPTISSFKFIKLSSVGLTSKLQYGVVHSEKGVNTQLYIALRTFVPYSAIPILGRTHVISHAVFLLWPVLTILHFQTADRRGWSFSWGSLIQKHLSITLYYAPIQCNSKIPER